MKKVLSYLFMPILYILLVSFYLLIIPSKTDIDYFFAISLIVESLFITFLVIFLNKDKVKEVRLFYILTISAISFSLILFNFYYMFSKTLINSTFYYWLIYFSIALYISLFIFQIVYTFKNFFKKGYFIEKFDFKHFIMLLNSLSYGLITYLFGNNIIKICGKAAKNLDSAYNIIYIYNFNLSDFLWITLYISIGYLALYSLISIIYHFKYDNDKGN